VNVTGAVAGILLDFMLFEIRFPMTKTNCFLTLSPLVLCLVVLWFF